MLGQHKEPAGRRATVLAHFAQFLHFIWLMPKIQANGKAESRAASLRFPWEPDYAG
jgi:hypothetical protein